MKQEKIWYLFIDEKEEGPYSFAELRSDGRITPETLARRWDVKAWKPIGKIPELKDLFKDSVDLKDLTDLSKPKFSMKDDELALPLNRQNPIFLLILMLIAFLIFLLFLQLNR